MSKAKYEEQNRSNQHYVRRGTVFLQTLALPRCSQTDVVRRLLARLLTVTGVARLVL